ncbi:MAG: hypothetical protein ACK4F9_01620 [Brevinematia bacterium]
MDKFKLPPEYKDFYHIKDSDLEKLNKHIEYFEKINYKKRIARRWFFGGIILILVIAFVLGVFDLGYIKRLIGFKIFLIKETVDFNGKKVNVRISMPFEGKVNVILEPLEFSGKLNIFISNKYEIRDIIVDDIKSVTMKFDRELFFVCESVIKKINVETLTPME